MEAKIPRFIGMSIPRLPMPLQDLPDMQNIRILTL
jgi:hypothetical protein